MDFIYLIYPNVVVSVNLKERGAIMKQLTNNKGLTLIEVIAAMALLSIILISFFGFFIQSKKTNVSSESIHDAAYLAQVEMEKMYTFASSRNSLTALNNTPLTIEGTIYQTKEPIRTNSCPSTPSDDPTVYRTIHSYTRDAEPYTINLTISTLCHYAKAGNVSIDVIEKSSNITKAKLENIYIWR